MSAGQSEPEIVRAAVATARVPLRNVLLTSSFGGIVLMVFATFVFAAQDALTKTLTQTLPVGQIVFVRFAAFAGFVCLLAYRDGGIRSSLRSAVPGRQIIRCLLMCSEIALFAFALQFLGIAEIHSLFACFPLFVAALSVPFLGERVGWRRWLAVVIGLIGTLIILRPGSAVFEPVALLPLVCAVIYAVYNLMTRQVSRRDDYLTSLMYFGLVGTAASAPFAFVQWQAPGLNEVFFLFLLCVTSICGHMTLIKALQLTEAVVLQPFHYLILPWAMIVGYIVFDEVIDRMTVVGAIIVVGSGVYVAAREHRLAQKAATAQRAGA